MNKLTKIVATVSDQRCDIPFLKSLCQEGVNVVRLNSAHMGVEGFDKVISNVRTVSKHMAILMDTKGPEVRTTVAATQLYFKTGDEVRVIAQPLVESTQECISVNYPDFVRDLSAGVHILIDDGELDFMVLRKSDDALYCVAMNDGVLGSRKSVNVPGVKINLPSLTQRDKEVIRYCIENDVDFIAHSFVRSKHDVLDIQAILDEHQSPIKIIAKIENQEGVDNIDDIIEVAYGVMVARGDLGIELAPEKIPAIQSLIIQKCITMSKPVIVATQMLHSMITSPRPTRAEVSDVAHAILSRTDAVMLSGETAYGKYPIEAVRTMVRIIREAEVKGESQLVAKPRKDIVSPTSFLAKQAVRATDKMDIQAILTDSFSGTTARNLAAYRGKTPIYAICYNERVARELSLSYGIWTILQSKENESNRDYYIKALRMLMNQGTINREDMVVYIGGSLAHHVGTTMLELNHAGDAIDYYDGIVK